MAYEIVIDSTCDLTKDIREKYGIYHDYIHGIIYFPNCEEKLADLDWNNYSSNEYYSIVKKNAGKLKTAFATYNEFVRVIEPILKAGKDAMVFVISSGISGAFNAYNNYKDILLDDYPERKIIIIDTLNYASGAGLLAIYAALKRDEGINIMDNASYINELRHHLHEIGIMDDLSFLSKNGRVSASKAFFGSLIGMQPVADMTIDGKNEPLGTIKGEDSANLFSIKYLKESIVDSKSQILVIAHSQREKRAKIFQDFLEKEVNFKELIVLEVGQSCGVNIGPGLCTYFFLGDKITASRDKEKALFNKLKEELK